MIFLVIVCVLGFIGVLTVKIMRLSEYKKKEDRVTAYIELANQFLDLFTTEVPQSCLAI
jgi:hypothetical protein